jgi:single-strand DNA-binding protein
VPDYKNRVELTGRIDREPTLHRFDSGSVNCSLSILTEYGKSKNWARVVVWGSDADMCAALPVGQWLAIVGYQKTRSYQDGEGRKVYITEVVAEVVDVLEDDRCEQPGDAEPPSSPASANPAPLEEGDDGFPF